MTPELLRRVGEALFGDHWQTALARAVGVSDRTMRRWVSGSQPIPDLRPELARIVHMRRSWLVGKHRALGTLEDDLNQEIAIARLRAEWDANHNA